MTIRRWFAQGEAPFETLNGRRRRGRPINDTSIRAAEAEGLLSTDEKYCTLSQQISYTELIAFAW